jgi:MFS transporter, PAT family, beta-lactamase induction signal transducer AmpG
VVLAAMMIIPALAVLVVVEPARTERRTPKEVFGGTLRDVGAVLFSKTGLTGILLCLSPVGTAALINYFNAIGVDYVRPEVATVTADPMSIEVAGRMLLVDLGEAKTIVEGILTEEAISERVSDVLVFTTGPFGIVLTAIGAFVGGWLCDRTNRRAMYLLSGALTAMCGIVMALSPRQEMTLIVGALVYQLITGFCYAAFTATVLETIGKAGKAASTQYTLFVAAGNGAITWVGLVDTRFAESYGVEGVVAADAILNLAGVIVLTVVFTVLGTFGKSKHKPIEPSSDEPGAADGQGRRA